MSEYLDLDVEGHMTEKAKNVTNQKLVTNQKHDLSFFLVSYLLPSVKNGHPGYFYLQLIMLLSNTKMGIYHYTNKTV